MGMLDRQRRGEWAKWLLASSPVLLLLGGIDYLRNLRFYGHPLGDPDSFELFAESARPDERIEAMFRNMRQAGVDNLVMDIPPRLAQRLPLLDRLSVWEPKVGTNYYLEVGQAWLGPLLTVSIAAGTMLDWWPSSDHVPGSCSDPFPCVLLPVHAVLDTAQPLGHSLDTPLLHGHCSGVERNRILFRRAPRPIAEPIECARRRIGARYSSCAETDRRTHRVCSLTCRR